MTGSRPPQPPIPTPPAEFSFEALELPAPAPAVHDDADAVLAAMAAAEAAAAAEREAARGEGFERGRAEALASAAPALAALEAAAGELRAAREALADRLEAHAVDLALLLAEKVTAAAIAVDPPLVLEAVRGALRGIVERERVTVLVHPDDLEFVRTAMDDLRASLGGIEHCEVQSERRVARGGAVVRTPEGDVDARVETKLMRAREVVVEVLSR
ncbi:MAG TPA: FliH/SctL family protein [Solirubrobacteraceae bacterium]|nr:FliH/SctL family protein [Solirubrobacteraceae bacterium]